MFGTEEDWYTLNSHLNYNAHINLYLSLGNNCLLDCIFGIAKDWYMLNISSKYMVRIGLCLS